MKLNILKCDCLVIDEIGLISQKIFEAVEFICRTIRENNRFFGGIQVIAAGSFKQLPPVPSFTDPGKYCFESPIFDMVFPHHMHLHEVVHQEEQDLIKAINEFCNGTPSKETLELVDKLKRPLPDDKKDDATYIFGTNFDVNFFNYDKLSKLPGNMKIYEAKDRCPQKYLKTCSAPIALPIKVNCKVMVIRNLDNGLVNRLTGTVIYMDDENICVKIDQDDKMDHNLGGCVFNLKRMEFILRDENNKKVGNRWQFPLKLGYAITVDKARGHTLEYLVIDCYNFWKCGPLGVAIGRAIAKYGLQILNFNIFSATLKYPKKVEDFTSKLGKPLKGDRSCCQQNMHNRN